MPIIGVTHSQQGEVLVRRSVMTKVAIGRGPSKGENYPKKLDHFIFLRKEAGDDKSVEWVDDETMQAHYRKLAGNEDPTEIVIILLDDDIDQVFRTEYAWWAQTGKKCAGDGEHALREINGERKPWENCANSGKCKEYEDGSCKPSADLYFMLADYPSLGTACRLHTSSYQSVREIYSALVDLKNMMGGRLMGLPVKLFVRPEKNVYHTNGGEKKTGTKWVLGLELRADSLPKLLENVSESAKVFADLRKIMGGRRIEIAEDDHERAREIADEFVHIEPAGSGIPKAELPPPAPPVDPNQKLFEELADSLGLNKANRHFLLARHNADFVKAIDELKGMGLPEGNAPNTTPTPEPKGKKKKGAAASVASSTIKTQDGGGQAAPASTEKVKFGF